MLEKHAALLCAALTCAGLSGCEAEGAGDTETPPGAVAVDTPATPGEIEQPVATQPAVLTLGRTPEHGEFVADARGRALYLFTADSQGSSNCYDACAQRWPPLVDPHGTPRAGAPQVQAQLIGTTRRRDGSAQVTYNGHPLYHYHGDEEPGQARGQDVHDSGGEWYLVTPEGAKLEEGEGGDTR